jgi:hypothetical protein
MPLEKHQNDLGGVSWVLTPDDSGFSVPANLDSRITGEERAVLAAPRDYFGRLASESAPYLSAFLSRLAEGHATHFEINISKYQPSLSESFLGIRLHNARFLVGVRDRSQTIGHLPPCLRPVYQVVNSTREADWMVAGGFLRPSSHEPPPGASQWARSPKEQIAAARICFASISGDGLAYLPNGDCVWYLHETETLVPVRDPAQVLREALEQLVAGRKYTPSKDVC